MCFSNILLLSLIVHQTCHMTVAYLLDLMNILSLGKSWFEEASSRMSKLVISRSTWAVRRLSTNFIFSTSSSKQQLTSHSISCNKDNFLVKFYVVIMHHQFLFSPPYTYDMQKVLFQSKFEFSEEIFVLTVPGSKKYGFSGNVCLCLYGSLQSWIPHQ